MVLFYFHCMAKIGLGIPGPSFSSMALWVGRVEKNNVTDSGGVVTAELRLEVDFWEQAEEAGRQCSVDVTLWYPLASNTEGPLESQDP